MKTVWQGLTIVRIPIAGRNARKQQVIPDEPAIDGRASQ
jgi:hypothetical protein